MEIRENVILAPYTTFRVGGPARYFVEVESVANLKDALDFSKENNLRFFVLGGGSNLLISDEGFNGLIIKMGIKGLEFKDEKNCSILSAGAGEDWDYVVGEAVELGLRGIENLSLIPGTVGAAAYQNIGAYGVELKDVLNSVEVLDAISGNIKTFSNSDCGFGYRDSVFKNKKGENLVILKTCLKLSKNQESKLNYPDLVKKFEGKNPSVLEIRNAVIRIRRGKLFYSDKIGNAGSFFKNPTVTVELYDTLVSQYPDLKGFKLENGMVKLFAAQLIEKLGWKGKTLGSVGVSEKHSLVLVNYGNGTAKEVVNLAENIKKSVKDEFRVILESEVEMI